MTWLAVALAAIAVDLWRPGAHRLVATRLRLQARRAWRRPRSRPAMLAVPVAIGVPLLCDGPLILVGLASAGAFWVALGVVRAARRRSRAAARRRAMVETLSFLVAELRAGAVPELALASVAAESVDLGPAARAAAAGADPVPVLLESAATPGLEALRAVAGAWQVAERSGAPVADVLARVVDRVRDDLDLGREVEAELAPARATARIMALLPLAGLALGSGAGGDPIGVVTQTWIGGVCVAAGIGLAVAGLLWIERVAATVTR